MVELPEAFLNLHQRAEKVTWQQHMAHLTNHSRHMVCRLCVLLHLLTPPSYTGSERYNI